MKIENICEKFLKEILYIIFAILVIPLIIVIFFIIGLPALTIRGIVVVIGKIFKRDLTIVSPGSGFYALDDFNNVPRNNILIYFVIKNELSVVELQNAVTSRILELRRKNGRLAYPELRKFIMHWMGFMFWKSDAEFNVTKHVRRYDFEHSDPELQLPTPFNESDFLKISSKLTSYRWEKETSPWEFLILDNYIIQSEKPSEKSTMIAFRFHHGLGDGYSILKLILNNLTRNESKIAKPNYVQRSLMKTIFRSFLLPFKVPYEFGKQLIESRDSNDWIKPNLSNVSYLVQSDPIPLTLIKDIKNLHQVSFMAVLVAALSGAFRKTLIESRLKVPKIMKSVTAIPIPGHPDKLRNHLSYLGIKFPVGYENPRERLKVSEKDLQGLRYSSLPATNFWLSKVMGMVPIPLIKVLRPTLVTTTMVSSNFPGPENNVFFLDREVVYLSGSNGLYYGAPGVSLLMLSYGGQMRISVNINKTLVPSEEIAHKISQWLIEEFAYLKALEVP